MNLSKLVKLRLLLSIEGIGPAKLRNLLSGFKSFDKILSAEYDSLISIPGINPKLADRILNSEKKESEIRSVVEKELFILDKIGANIVTVWDNEYPPLLKKIFDPPLLLYTRGNFTEQDNYSIAIVGTRVPTNYGRIQCEKIASELSQQGITIVSGLARGIDSIAHQTIVRNNGRTIAVIGSGLDVIYPPENKKLYTEILEKGMVISEFSPGTKPDAQNFPQRNRIISGLSLGTIIIETGTKGGALQTASLALDQNREIFAVPGNLGIKQSEGTNLLIQKGEAKLIRNYKDVLEELELKLQPMITEPIQKQIPNLNLFEEKIVNSLKEKELHIDDISSLTEIPVSDCLVNLLTLEFKGIVKQLPGKVFAVLS